MTHTQFFSHPFLGVIQFHDTRDQVYSQPCQPRDIVVLDFGLDAKQVKDAQEEIAVDIRIASGVPVHKARKKLKFN